MVRQSLLFVLLVDMERNNQKALQRKRILAFQNVPDVYFPISDSRNIFILIRLVKS